MKDNGHSERHVLVVDDDDHLRSALTGVLTDMNLTVDSSPDGRAAIRRLQERSFDLMLLDLRLPEVDGMDVLRWAREHRPAVEIIIISAYGTAADAIEAMEMGAQDFLRKPCTTEEIRRRVTRVLKKIAHDGAAWRDRGAHVPPGSTARIDERQFDAAAGFVYEALRYAGDSPAAYRYLGMLYELLGDDDEAVRCFERALSLDFSFAPAMRDLRELIAKRARSSSGRIENEKN
jgi:DNA-binding response OmpR family regulator